MEKEKKKNLNLQKEPIMEGKLTGYPSIDKPWMKWYDKNKLNKTIKSTNCFDYLFEATNDYPENKLLKYYGKEYTREDIKFEVEKNIKMFSSMDLNPGDVVSLIMIDVPEVLFMFLALSKMGVITNLIKFDEVPERINSMMNLTNSKYLFASEVPFILTNVKEAVKSNDNIEKIIIVKPTQSTNMIDILKDTDKMLKSKKHNKITYLSELKNELISAKNMMKECKTIIDKDCKFVDYNYWINTLESDNSYKYNTAIDDVCLIVYTGGTTGDAKGVQLTNRNIIESAFGFKASDWGFDEDKTSLNILPPAIAYYFNATYNMMCCGVNTTLIANFKLDEYPNLLKVHRPNIFLSGPILLKMVAENDIVQDASFMTNPISGGDKMYIDEEKKFNDYVKKHGGNTVVRQGYGESECTAAATYSKFIASKLGSIGIPMINVDVSIFDIDTEEELKVGEENIGEIWISGPTLMKGYIDNSEETKKILVLKNGKIWLKTGDLGYMDCEGRLYHKGRIKRMLTRSGNKVWLTFLEETIKSVPSINDCCCVKLNDEEEREVPVAHIVLEPNISIDDKLKEIKEKISATCPEAYMPKFFVLKDELPYTEVNKKMDYKALEKENIFDSEKFSIIDNIVKLKRKMKVLK